MTNTEKDPQRSKANIRLALAIGAIALAIYVGFIYLTGTSS